MSIFKQRSLFITSGSKKEEYKEGTFMSRTSLHWGQRKLLISEIIWLVNHWNPETHPSPIFVYPGSIPGRHLNVLIRMFPQFTYVLYDTDSTEQGERRQWDFDTKIESMTKNMKNFIQQRGNKEETKILTDYDLLENNIKQGGVIVVPKYFFDIDAEFFAQRFSDNCFLCVDIRDLNYFTFEKDHKVTNAVVMRDMEIQKKWVQTMKPVSSLLKFRLPWVLPGETWEGTTEYFSGQIYVQAWAPPTSSETRLCTDGTETVKYNNKLYEDMLYYHNNHIREKETYTVKVNSIAKDINFVTKETGYDNRFDSSMEIFVLSEYLQKYQFKGDVSTKIREISELIDKSLGGPSLESRRENVSAISRYREIIAKGSHSLKQQNLTKDEIDALRFNVENAKKELAKLEKEDRLDDQ